MTITRTVASSFLITLGLLLGSIAWGGYFERPPSSEQLVAGRPAAGVSSATAATSTLPPIIALRERTRFVALAKEPARPQKIAQPQASKTDTIKTAAASPAKAKDKSLAATKARRTKPQQTAQWWPWAFFGN
jgi:hypothetical protein